MPLAAERRPPRAGSSVPAGAPLARHDGARAALAAAARNGGRPRRNARQQAQTQARAQPARSPRELVRASQRLRIVLAAASCARTSGLAELTSTAIVEASGVSRRHFYELFDGREDCLLAAFEEGVRQAGALILPAYEAADSWRESIHAGLEALLSFLEQQPVLGGFCLLDSAGAGARLLRRRAELTAALAAAVDAGRAQAVETAGLTPIAAECVVGGVLAVLAGRILADEHAQLRSLTGELMAAIVRPYLGPAAAQAELQRAESAAQAKRAASPREPLNDLPVRWTHRMIAAIEAVAAHPGASNRVIGEAAGLTDQGQVSKLLSRLQRQGLIENYGGPPEAGLPNAWELSPTGASIAAQLSAR